MNRLFALAFVSVVAVVAVSGCVSDPGPGGRFRGNGTFGPGNMTETIDACAGMAENDTCSFDMNGEIIQGICMIGRDQQMMCMPEGMGDFNRTGRPDMGEIPDWRI